MGPGLWMGSRLSRLIGEGRSRCALGDRLLLRLQRLFVIWSVICVGEASCFMTFFLSLGKSIENDSRETRRSD